MAETTIDSFTEGNVAIVKAAMEELEAASTAMTSGSVGPEAMYLLMAATAKFTMIVEATSSIQKSFDEACVSPSRKIS